MALIKCPECGKEISDKAPSCPGCGCPVSAAASTAAPAPAASAPAPAQAAIQAPPQNGVIIKGSSADTPVKSFCFALKWIFYMVSVLSLILFIISIKEAINNNAGGKDVIIYFLQFYITFLIGELLSQLSKKNIISVTKDSITGTKPFKFIPVRIAIPDKNGSIGQYEGKLEKLVSVSSNTKNSVILTTNMKNYEFKNIENCNQVVSVINEMLPK